MTNTPLSDVVSNQYARWMYPQPILDIQAWLGGNWQWFDPSHAHRMFWPDRNYKPDMDILIAGCGTNQAAVFAYLNPQARVVALDVSQPSLDHHQYLIDKYGMKNLELHLLPIEEASTLNRDFGLIVSTGVLHHLAVPENGMKALAKCLRPDGVMAIMLYAEFGRLGVEMLQAVFRDMGLRQDDASVLMVREALAALPDDHPINSYMAIAPDLQYDAGLVDTFLHGRERSYDVSECIELVQSAGLVFQDLFMKSPYYPPVNSANAFYETVSGLADETQWSIMERVNFKNGCHFFTACRSDRPKDAYKIDFSRPAASDYMPSFRYRCGYSGNEIFRHNWRTALDPTQLSLIMNMDGQRTIAEIAALTGATESGEAVKFFEALWKLDFVAMGLKPTLGRSPKAPGKRRAAGSKNKDALNV